MASYLFIILFCGIWNAIVGTSVVQQCPQIYPFKCPKLFVNKCGHLNTCPKGQNCCPFASPTACGKHCVGGGGPAPPPPHPPVLPPTTDICSLPKSRGPCRGHITRYFFDTHRRRCHRFSYGGCKGNANNFASHHECTKRCYTGFTCDAPIVKGTCHWHARRWGYDKQKGRCILFWYSGCGGNGNNFPNRHECNKQCKKHNPHTHCKPTYCKCRYGQVYETDSNGCKICKCKPSPCLPYACPKTCNNGYDYQTDSNGCKICKCKPWTCKPTYCPKCQYGVTYETDSNGCKVCKCKTYDCPTPSCPKHCPYGVEYVTDSHGYGK
ncbi:papilin-like [Mytilus californianus]|uniref:papilin-like n=1 Tax=Mytilus californianus TaxID=6549 RepID=UPI0022474180|nr:papilin-like [Mytilus californianus]